MTFLVSSDTFFEAWELSVDLKMRSESLRSEGQLLLDYFNKLI